MTKTAVVQMWVYLPPQSEGAGSTQRSRICVVSYTVNPIGSDHLYEVKEIKDKRTGEVHPLTESLPLNDCLDEKIAAANPTMVEFARRELATDLKAPLKKGPKPPPKPMNRPKTLEELL